MRYLHGMNERLYVYMLYIYMFVFVCLYIYMFLCLEEGDIIYQYNDYMVI